MKLEKLIAEIKKTQLPTEPVRLTKQETIIDAKTFVNNHLSVLENNSGKRIFKPYYDRLLAFYNSIK